MERGECRAPLPPKIREAPISGGYRRFSVKVKKRKKEEFGGLGWRGALFFSQKGRRMIVELRGKGL